MPEVDEAIAARRPLKSRSTWWAAWLSTRLVWMHVSPNAISMISIAFAGVAAAAFIATRYVERPIGDALLFIAAIVGIQGRLLCNLMDGMVAVEGGKRTPSGELFNEVPDRVADTLILVAAGYAGDPKWGPTLGWAAALLAMFTAYVRAVGKAAGAGTYFLGPMAKPHRMAALTLFCVISMSIAIHAHVSPLKIVYASDGRPVPRMKSFEPAYQESHNIDVALFVICAGCIPTIWRRLSRIVADLCAQP